MPCATAVSRAARGGLCALAVAGLIVLASPRAADAQTPYGNYETHVAQDTGGQPESLVKMEVAEIHGLFFDDVRGVRAHAVIGGLAEFVFGFDGIVLWQQQPDSRGGRDERFSSFRLFVGFDLIEITKFGVLRIDLSYAFGEHLLGDDAIGAIGFGVLLSVPIITGPGGAPILRGESRYRANPFKGARDQFEWGTSLIVYPIPGGPLQQLGFSLGYTLARDLSTPWDAITIGVVFGAPL